MKEALFYEKKENNKVHCHLCPHNCMIGAEKLGACRVRHNQEGILFTENYGRLSSIQVDPVEKKPLNHFIPGTYTLSIGSYGCNFKCDFCQNYEISLETPATELYTSEELVSLALDNGLPSISYTYNEPTVFYEFMLETAKLAHANGLKNIVVTNGFINQQPLLYLLPYIDAMNIDLKTYDPSLYQSVCGGTFEDVVATIKAANQLCHVEVTLLIVPELFASIDEIRIMFADLKETCGELILHLSRYFPRYKRNEKATSIDYMLKVKEIAILYFEKVYLGNV